MTKQTMLMLALTAVVVTACGGGGGEAAPAPAPTAAVPDSASQSATGLATYLTALSTAPADDLEPVDVSNFVPPTSDTTEPEPVS
jgi:hypothetical protein